MDVFERLRAAAPDEWARYVEHPFVRQLGDGTLPEAAFRAYLVQDYLFLIQFARAYALAAYKSRTTQDIRAAQAGLAAILDETELHIRLCARWGIGVDELAATPEEAADRRLYALRAGLRGGGRPPRPARRPGPCVVATP